MKTGEVMVSSRIDTVALFEPLTQFPGDEAISPETYASCMEGRYSSLVVGSAAAAEQFGLKLDTVAIELWKRVAVGAGMLDTFLDEAPDQAEAVAVYQQGIAHIRGEADIPKPPVWADERLEPMVELLRNGVDTLPEARQTTLLRAAHLIARISLAKAASTDVDNYKKLLRAEGQLSGVLVTESASEYVYQQPGYRDFSRWVTDLMEVATFVDSALDLKQDNKDGLTGVEPTVANSACIGKGAFRGLGALCFEGANRRALVDAVKAKRRFQKDRDLYLINLPA